MMRRLLSVGWCKGEARDGIESIFVALAASNDQGVEAGRGSVSG